MKLARKTPSKPIGILMLSAALAGCMGGGGSIPSASAPITTQESSQGAEFHPQLLQEFGGTYQGPQAAYVEQVGKNIAVQSGLGNARGSFTVSLLNSPVNNAFAVPGGYIYTTRQLVGLMNNEAELAAVLGHEVGHVAARHSQRRQSASQRNSIFGGLGALLSGVLLGDSAIGNLFSRGFQQGSQLLTLKFSRSQELQADQLGITYLTKAGYDPGAMSSVLASLAAQKNLEARLQGRGNASIPAWASTHPDPASRVRSAAEMARQAGAQAGSQSGGQTGGQVASSATGTTNRDAFLSRIDGMLYGDDPAQGMIDGQKFIHPTLRLSFTAPRGFYMVNGARAVSINGQGGQAKFSTGVYDGNLEKYLRSAFAAMGGSGGQSSQLAPSNIQRTRINGLPAMVGTAKVNSGNSQLDLAVFAYEFSDGKAFHFAAITPAGKAGTFITMFRSMRRISTSEAAQLVPRRIDVVTVRGSDTVETLAARMAYSDGKVERFRVLNGLGNNENLRAGQKVKLIIRAR